MEAMETMKTMKTMETKGTMGTEETPPTPSQRGDSLCRFEGGGVASDKFFYAGEDAHAPRRLPLPPQGGGTAMEEGNCDGDNRNKENNGDNRDDENDGDSPYPLKEGDSDGGGGQNEEENCDGNDEDNENDGVLRRNQNFSFRKWHKKERRENKESINIHKPFKI